MDRKFISDASRVEKKCHSSRFLTWWGKNVKKVQFFTIFVLPEQPDDGPLTDSPQQILAKHMQTHATVLPNLAGKCQILHFFGFFSPLLCIFV